MTYKNIFIRYLKKKSKKKRNVAEAHPNLHFNIAALPTLQIMVH